MNKKKILYVITKSNWGGAQRYVYDLATNLPKEQFDVVVALGGNGDLASRLKSAGIRVVYIKNLERNIHIGKELKSFLELLKIIKNERPEIIHINSSKAGILGTLAGRLAHVPLIVFTAHAWAFNEDRKGLAKFFIKKLHWLTVALSHKTITVSEAVRGQMSDVPSIVGKMQTIYPGRYSPIFVERSEARRLLGIKDSSFAIGTIAELHPVKGLKYAISAIETLPFEKTYTIIGVGDEKENLEKQIESSEFLKKSVNLAGFMEDAGNLLKAFDLFILPSLSEAFGYVLLEAGYAGLPIIATAVGGIPEIIESNVLGILVQPKDSSGLSEAIKNLYNDREKSLLLGQNIKKMVSEKFSLEKMLKKTSALYLSS